MREQHSGTPQVPELELPLGEYMAGVRERIGQGIDEYIADAPDEFKAEIEHSLAGDKAGRIRPALTYITGDTFNISREKLDELALATDLIHTASLVWDDLPSQDDSDFRRGKKALHLEFGVGAAELTALTMLADAGTIVGEIEKKHGLKDGSLISSYIWGLLGRHGLALGQKKDLEAFGRDPEDITIEELDEITDLKTGKAIEMGIVGAATIGGVDGEIVDILREYSYHCGIAYQVKDDLRDVMGNDEEIGKPTGLDAKNQKPTYFDLLGKDGCKEKIDQHVQAATAALDRLPDEYRTGKFSEILNYFAAM